MTDADGRVAVITGATDGIGLASASELARRGWRVVVVSRNPDRCAAAVARIINDAGRPDAALAVPADLTSLHATADAIAQIRSRVDRLDLLPLNANVIAHEHTLTPEGHEANLAIGLHTRVLLTVGLEGLLRRTPGAQILGVVGQALDRFDTPDADFTTGYAAMAAVGRWQWAWQVWARTYAAQVPLLVNTYMPGLVRTKVLLGDPHPERRTQLEAMIATQAITVEESALDVARVVDQVRQTSMTHRYLAIGQAPVTRALGSAAGDAQAVWRLTQSAVGPLLAPPRA
ncbi:MAG TPA: SDR family NAD(P)-dependent oxidoreductase [Phycicoccus elongatus]|nr:SDR family NAD(P)-dependent oxidoreductase [Phycicoccus elongatus]